ncbi:MULTISPECIES: hypothetical protein [Leptolyngbya]|nr:MULTISPECIES: hypothetical protein [Leptolyngbya]MBD2366503.1 hypothetical protein [Leptolyngbya sp. FACHB-161]MBD2372682.1 hypothetical protein [Leptolyngbya sp. FACHB-238]MBD2397105.1 hypothetical protein [Leptolyngbya sp. FACHB-239]MBD2403629.1 hypothetical protein [Leptolyngbya sp. FACHB-402]ULP27559.1 hypothetical protein MCP04_16090 [Leptolyngbya boryana IU 594]
MPQTLIDPKIHVRQVAFQVFSGCSRTYLEKLHQFLSSEDATEFESDEISGEYFFDNGDSVMLTITCHLSELALDFDWCSEADVQEAHYLLEVLSEWLENPVTA